MAKPQERFYKEHANSVKIRIKAELGVEIKVRVTYTDLPTSKKMVKVATGVEVTINPPKNDKWVEYKLKNHDNVIEMIREHIQTR